MKINEIFKSIEGEGIRTGAPVTFIRLYGCNLNCSYCDTRYSCTGEEYTEMNLSQVTKIVDAIGINKVTVTGGEPLMHEGVYELISDLAERGYEVNIETNGSIDIYPYLAMENVIITMDWKSPSSGMNPFMLQMNVKYLRPNDVLKFVVGCAEDLKEMKAVLKNYQPNCHVFVSPVFGKIEPVDIVEYLLENNLQNCRMQLQLHKLIWEPTKRGV